MAKLPQQLQTLVTEFERRNKTALVLRLDEHGKLLDIEGNAEPYGLDSMQRGETLSDYGFYLEELLPQPNQPFQILDLECKTGCYSTVYLQSENKEHWVLMFDRSQEALKEFAIRQQFNEVQLKR